MGEFEWTDKMFEHTLGEIQDEIDDPSTLKIAHLAIRKLREMLAARDAMLAARDAKITQLEAVAEAAKRVDRSWLRGGVDINDDSKPVPARVLRELSDTLAALRDGGDDGK